MDTMTTQQFDIRRPTADDVVAVRRMQAASWLAAYQSDVNGVSVDWINQETDQWIQDEQINMTKDLFNTVSVRDAAFYRVATINDEVVGVVIATQEQTDVSELGSLYITPEQFGSGLGQQLMNQVIDWSGQSAIELEVVSYNARAVRFYERNGFTIVSGSESTYKDTIPLIKMKRERGLAV